MWLLMDIVDENIPSAVALPFRFILIEADELRLKSVVG
jgi:hypothetical protein